ncbi:MAG: DUF3431 domain-containing protein [Pseudomonadota bacterium]|nr:DUF3431 domain-containing protein [Pseudomonadota bacterium]
MRKCDEGVFWWFFSRGIGLLFLDHCITKMAYIMVSLAVLGANFFAVPDRYFDRYHYLSYAYECSYVTPSDWLRAEFGYWYHRSSLVKPDLIVAHYREDLSWLSAVYDRVGKIYLYCKDPKFCVASLPDRYPSAKVEIATLPNVGREAHTYLHHIVKHYHNLSKEMVFTMGSVLATPARYISLLKALSADNAPCVNLTAAQRFSLSDVTMVVKNKEDYRPSLGNSLDRTRSKVFSSDIRPLGRWVQHFFGVDLSHKTPYCPRVHGAIFLTTKKRIKRYSRAVYAAVLADLAKYQNPESGFFLERLWPVLL